ncbi:MAG: hypothetical protein KGO81_01860 [Bacteroidota bacterium]|nr:hypothetical protein [Bacteroidota bacterium]
MKKLLAILAVAGVMAACNNAKTDAASADSTKKDSATVAVDTTKKDSAAMPVDTTKKDTTKK